MKKKIGKVTPRVQDVQGLQRGYTNDMKATMKAVNVAVERFAKLGYGS